MTAWNEEKFILESVQSILEQTLQDFEFIIVDDGSTDRTGEKLKTINDPRVILRMRPHQGRGAALNFAVALAGAPVVAFQDADDIAVPNRLEQQLGMLNRRREVGVVSGWYRKVTPDGRLRGTVRLPSTHHAIAERMYTTCAACFGASAIRKALIASVGGFREDLECAIDYDLMLRLMDRTEFVNLPMPLVLIRHHRNSISGLRFDDQRANSLRLIQNYARRVAGSHPQGLAALEIEYRMGVAEYCYGSMDQARVRLKPLMKHARFRWKALRYIIPSFGGNRLFSLYRTWRYRRS